MVCAMLIQSLNYKSTNSILLCFLLVDCMCVEIQHCERIWFSFILTAEGTAFSWWTMARSLFLFMRLFVCVCVHMRFYVFMHALYFPTVTQKN